jgi:hypothetical protein
MGVWPMSAPDRTALLIADITSSYTWGVGPAGFGFDRRDTSSNYAGRNPSTGTKPPNADPTHELKYWP